MSNKYRDPIFLKNKYPNVDLPWALFSRVCTGLNVCTDVPSRLAKCPEISHQWNFHNELKPDDALLGNKSAQWPFVKLGTYCCIIFPLSSIELQQLLQLKAILHALRTQNNFQLALSHYMLKVASSNLTYYLGQAMQQTDLPDLLTLNCQHAVRTKPL